MLKVIGSLSLVSLFILLIGCSAPGDEKDEIRFEPGALDIILCQEPRSQVCTREYDPVCATMKDGSIKTGATGCTSCSDPEVVGYKKGECAAVSLN